MAIKLHSRYATCNGHSNRDRDTDGNGDRHGRCNIYQCAGVGIGYRSGSRRKCLGDRIRRDHLGVQRNQLSTDSRAGITNRGRSQWQRVGGHLGGLICRYTGSTFVNVPGIASDIGVGADGTVWVTNPDGTHLAVQRNQLSTDSGAGITNRGRSEWQCVGGHLGGFNLQVHGFDICKRSGNSV